MQEFLVVVRVALSLPYAHWEACFDGDKEARAAGGITDVFRAPVLGQQAALYGVRTTQPRMVHDFVYEPLKRAEIESSGFIVGAETITVCEWTGDVG